MIPVGGSTQGKNATSYLATNIACLARLFVHDSHCQPPASRILVVPPKSLFHVTVIKADTRCATELEAN